MTSIVLKRIKAFIIDYLIILTYIGVLLAVTLFISRIFSLDLKKPTPALAQLIGFTTLTLPVILYFTLSENGRYAGTLGKKRFGLQVRSVNLEKAGFGQLLIRNCIKFLP